MAENFTIILEAPPHLDPEVPLALYLADTAINAVSSVATIIGNVLIITALRKIPLTQVHAVFKMFIFNLALADLGVGIIVQPLFISTVLATLSGCANAARILRVMFYLSNFYLPNMSLVLLTAIAIDRFLALHFPLRYRNLVKVKNIIASLSFIWLWTLASTSLIVYDSTMYNISANCALALCLSTITFCYLKIYLTLKRHDKTVRGFVAPLQAIQANCETETVRTATRFNILRYRRSVYNMMYVYFAFVLCYLPFFCILIVIHVRGIERATKLSRILGVTLIFINSSVNPFLYCWKIREIRRVVLRTLKNIFGK